MNLRQIFDLIEVLSVSMAGGNSELCLELREYCRTWCTDHLDALECLNKRLTIGKIQWRMQDYLRMHKRKRAFIIPILDCDDVNVAGDGHDPTSYANSYCIDLDRFLMAIRNPRLKTICQMKLEGIPISARDRAYWKAHRAELQDEAWFAMSLKPQIYELRK